MREAQNEGGPVASRGFAMKGVALFGATRREWAAWGATEALLALIGAPCHPLARMDIV
jgi:hypothetical protein